jgi:Sec-independent protein translocase protein TatA
MSTAEVLLTVCVAIIVIPPSKWPLCAHHLQQGLRKWQQLQQQLHRFWQQQLLQHQLNENQARAVKMDNQED